MSVPIIIAGYAPTLGSTISGAATSLTLSADSGQNGHVWMLIDSEIMDGDKSGTTVSGLNRASEKYNGVQSAVGHTAGASVYFILSSGMAQASFPTKIDEKLPSAATVTFSSIPQNFRDLRILWAARGNSGNATDVVQMQWNADAGGNYDAQVSTTAGAGADTNAQTLAGTSFRVGIVGGTVSATLFNGGWIDIREYNQANFRPTWTAQCWRNDSSVGFDLMAGAWRTSAAITSIVLQPAAGTFIANSRFTLWGMP